jgi:hypothetical protein
LILARLNDITESHLQSLLGARAEDTYIDFKVDWSQAGYDGLAADVCAFANTEGGDIIIGMAENDRIASRLIGVSCDNVDQQLRKVEEGIRSRIEPLAWFRVKYVSLDGGNGAFVIRIEASVAAPHRVSKTGIFYSRGSTGNREMDIFQVREAFMRGTLAEERIRQFRTTRVAALPNTVDPLISSQNAWALFQVVSVPAMMRSRLVQADVLKESAFDVVIFGNEQSTGAPIRFNLDGVVRGRDQNKVQLFRDGKIEAQRLLSIIDHRMISGTKLPEPIELGVIRDGVREALPNYIQALQEWNFPPPYSASLTLSNMRSMPIVSSETGGNFAADRPVIEIPEVTTEAAEPSIKKAARQITDMLYQAFGLEKTIR